MSKPLVGVSKKKNMAECFISNPFQPKCGTCGSYVSLSKPTSFKTQRYICTKCGHAGLKAQG